MSADRKAQLDQVASNLLDQASPELRANWIDCLLHPEEWDHERSP